MRKLKFTFILLSLFIGSASLMAQVTTSTLSGKITETDGQPLPGATIIATHVPSGTVYGASANTQGSYSIQGMRPGGPYTVNVTFIGYQTQRYTEITLLLGENTTLNSTLAPTTTEMTEVTVIGYASSKFNTTQTGAVTNISNT
ncbi:MAG TPA: carboxypeptidase-like regulatory domain-containing protein, partial [Bacteroidales bacterium]|nr:carboxypeptidase-like regulatory domain-containing protein [Bacteroidales bacterium]HPQ64787.1 carboxypeptidase-like regulatory domain-containing protein [Bacteroidales bacterium]